MSQVKLNVTGMSCAACQAHVEKALGKTPGVSQATVSLMTNSASVTYDEKVVSPADLIAAVEHSGYGASVANPGGKAAKGESAADAAKKQQAQHVRRKARPPQRKRAQHSAGSRAQHTHIDAHPHLLRAAEHAQRKRHRTPGHARARRQHARRRAARLHQHRAAA